MILKLLFVIAGALVLTIIWVVYSHKTKQIWPEYASRTVYFKGWGGYSEFPIPQHEIGDEHVPSYQSAGKTYYEGTFDEEGRMIIWKKHQNNELIHESKW